MKYVTLCGRPKGCCPVLGKPGNEENYYTIKDKGVEIVLTMKEAKRLKKEL